MHRTKILIIILLVTAVFGTIFFFGNKKLQQQHIEGEKILNTASEIKADIPDPRLNSQVMSAGATETKIDQNNIPDPTEYVEDPDTAPGPKIEMDRDNIPDPRDPSKTISISNPLE